MKGGHASIPVFVLSEVARIPRLRHVAGIVVRSVDVQIDASRTSHVEKAVPTRVGSDAAHSDH